MPMRRGKRLSVEKKGRQSVFKIPLKAGAYHQRGKKSYNEKKNMQPISLARASHVNDLLVTRRVNFAGRENLLGIVF